LGKKEDIYNKQVNQESNTAIQCYSIVIPAWNCSEQLDRLLNMISEQDYIKEHYEVLVVDDGSTDDTYKCAVKHSARVIKHEKNMGRVMTRETGAKNAKYETLVFIDARCTIEKDLLKNAAELNHLPLMGVGLADKTISIIDRVFYCIRKKVYAPFEPQSNYNEELWIKPGEFDGRPKGTGLLIINRDMFLDSALEEKSQDVNDDTKLLANIVEKAPILRHTKLSFFYEHRHNWPELLKHTFFRGPKFYDYYLTPGGPLALKYYAGIFAIIGLISCCILFPQILLPLIIILLLTPTIIAIWMSEEIKDFFACLIFFPPVAIAFISGITVAQFSRIFRMRSIVKH
jgi:glycosyltransferase involved in cell wall biosynthesis